MGFLEILWGIFISILLIGSGTTLFFFTERFRQICLQYIEGDREDYLPGVLESYAETKVHFYIMKLMGLICLLFGFGILVIIFREVIL